MTRNAARAALVVMAVVSVGALLGCARLRSGSGAADSPSDGFVWIGEVDVPASLPRGAERMLDRNGFVVLGDVEAHNIKDAYFAAYNNFITSDAVLYVFHCLFRGGLSAYEKQHMVPLSKKLAEEGLAQARAQYQAHQGDPLLEEPARQNVVFFAVAQTLLTGKRPRDERAEVSRIVAKIRSASQAGFYPSEDYTVYRPRGVYAEDRDLAAYFRATKWFSRTMLPIIPGRRDGEPDASIKLRQAYLLGRMLDRGPLRQTWQKLYDEIGFFVAKPDSFTPVTFLDAVRGIPGPPDSRWVAAVRQEFAKSKYPASQIVPVPQRWPGDAPDKYVQFMGERYIPDGQIHQEACFPHVAGRTVPKGLDIGYALFGSDRAKHHLAGEFAVCGDLEPALTRLHGVFSTYASSKTPDSIYAGWIGAVRAILDAPSSPHIPEFFASDAWRDKSLSTALASWTQVRHDFVLYAKQPVTPMCAGMGFLVEPVPQAYERLEYLAGKLKEREFPGMADFEKLCRALKLVSLAELKGENWLESAEGAEWEFFLNRFGQWLLGKFAPHVAVERPCVVVDVYTSSNPPNPVLHEGTGPFNLVVAQGGEFGDYNGWVLSHYEFTEDNFTRLTDEEWERRVERGEHGRARPEWVKSYMYLK